MKRLLTVLCLLLASGCSQKEVDAAGSSLASAAPEFANDALIVGQIEGAYVTIDPASALHVAVSSHDGVVSLTGKVRSAPIRDQFIAAAKKTKNVKRTDASLAVDPNLPSAKDQVADFALAAAVQANIAGQSGVNALGVHVVAHAGVVTLTGNVSTPALRSTIVAAAKGVAGVRRVADRLDVRS
jgi:hyperosmotically inducible protein